MTGPISLIDNFLGRNRLTSNVNYGRYLPSGEPSCSAAREDLILLREWIELQDEIGQGCFGKVYRGRFRRPGPSSSDAPVCDELVAVKVLKTSCNAGGTNAERDLFHEARTMAEFSHPNILAVRGVVINGKKKSVSLDWQLRDSFFRTFRGQNWALVGV